MTKSIDEQLHRIAEFARRIREEVLPIPDSLLGRVHLRPGGSGVGLVGLDLDRPQCGKGGFTNLRALRQGLEEAFHTHCHQGELGRLTPEKAVQSRIIAEAYRHDRMLGVDSSSTTWSGLLSGVEFVTDEAAIFTPKKRLCDILGLEVVDGHYRGVVMELKSGREKKVLIEQVTTYAGLIDAHLVGFSKVYSAVLGREVTLQSPTRKVIVWPRLGDHLRDPHTDELAELGIEVVTYALMSDRCVFTG